MPSRKKEAWIISRELTRKTTVYQQPQNKQTEFQKLYDKRSEMFGQEAQYQSKTISEQLRKEQGRCKVRG